MRFLRESARSEHSDRSVQRLSLTYMSISTLRITHNITHNAIFILSSKHAPHALLIVIRTTRYALHPASAKSDIQSDLISDSERPVKEDTISIPSP